MAAPSKINFKVYQGSTFSETLRWEGAEKTYVPITAITKAAPVVITTAGHSIPVGWRTKVTNVLGMKEINSAETYNTVTAATATTVTINNINSLAYTDYTSSGVLEYNTPVDLGGFTARMQIRGKLEDTGVISELTTENGGILLDNTAKTIVLTISATATAAFTFSTAVYSLELVSSGGIVTPFCNGVLSLVKEVTR